MAEQSPLLTALRTFADDVRAKMSQPTTGEPEDQLRAPFENLMHGVAQALSRDLVCVGETLLEGRLGKPDYAVSDEGLLAGYVELKAPGTGADPGRFSGHNREQWKRFSTIPNLIYSDGNSWGLYRYGDRVRGLVQLSGDVTTEGRAAVRADEARALHVLLTDFLSWEPVAPTSPRGLAELLAPLCRMLRDDVTESLAAPSSALVQLSADWKRLLFPDANDTEFADAYAQTVTFALLLARSEGADPLDVSSAERALRAEHSLLARALQILTEDEVRKEISASVSLLERVVGAVVPGLLGGTDPWLYFYEDFLAAYDSNLRKDYGVYFTPVEVVHAQVALVGDVLKSRLGKSLGFADPSVITLDPAVGTGTFLLGIIERTLDEIKASQGAGAVPGHATRLARNLYGFDIMVGPFAVSELRVSRALADRGAQPPADGTHVYLTDTLESPHATPPQLSLYERPIAEQHQRAIAVKAGVPVIVCIGNPPYDRHEAAGIDNRARTGGWVRWGDDGTGDHSMFRDFLDPAEKAGHGVRVHNLYNLYVYFWRWALWKVFEQSASAGPGVVCFISAASYLGGDAFCGMREHIRRVCDEIWVLDLGGEGRGTRRTQNVFAIQTPVAIAVAVRYGAVRADSPAKAHYASVEVVERIEKLQILGGIGGLESVQWADCPDDWQAPFRPAGTGTYFDWPLLTDLFPWQQVGVKAGRTWVIAPEAETLQRRWEALCGARSGDRRRLFKDSPTGRKVTDTPSQVPPRSGRLKALLALNIDEPVPQIVPFGYRTLDRQVILADARLIDRPSPTLWGSHGPSQVYLTTLINHPLGGGPAVTACAEIPDLHHFRGSFGAKEIVPLYRDSSARDANVVPGLLKALGGVLETRVAPDDLLAYAYGILAQPAFTERYRSELGTRELRLPITKDPELYWRVREIGAKQLWLHTYGKAFVPNGGTADAMPRGSARCTTAVPGAASEYPERYQYDAAARTLRVGRGEFTPVAPSVYQFQVSGLNILQSWLDYRMKNGSGRTSSPLDSIRPERWTSEFTTEHLDLLWVLEATLAEYPAMERLLDAVVSGQCFLAEELPPVPDWCRRPPGLSRQPELLPLDDEPAGDT